MKADTIVAYTYKADIYCPKCVVVVAEAPAPESRMDSIEDRLDRAASTLSIDRYNEASYDSDRFPKVVFADQVETCDHCGGCGEFVVETSCNGQHWAEDFYGQDTRVYCGCDCERCQEY